MKVAVLVHQRPPTLPKRRCQVTKDALEAGAAGKTVVELVQHQMKLLGAEVCGSFIGVCPALLPSASIKIATGLVAKQ